MSERTHIVCMKLYLVFCIEPHVQRRHCGALELVYIFLLTLKLFIWNLIYSLRFASKLLFLEQNLLSPQEWAKKPCILHQVVIHARILLEHHQEIPFHLRSSSHLLQFV